MRNLTPKTKIAGLLGNPVSHSISPRLHDFLASAMGIDMVYLAFCVENKDKLWDVLEGAKNLGFLGLNITAPYKMDAFTHADVLDEEAKAMGNINTLVLKEGKWHGKNTDGEGFIRMLSHHGISPRGKHILLLGAGGTGRTLSYKFCQNGAESITVLARRESAVREVESVVKAAGSVDFYSDLDTKKAYDIVVNCTPLGMEPHLGENPAPKDLLYFPGQIFCDLIYNPPETPFLKEAKKRGGRCLNGLGMLLYQGILAFEHFTDTRVSEEICHDVFAYFEK